jgi:hypothetical protein
MVPESSGSVRIITGSEVEVLGAGSVTVTAEAPMVRPERTVVSGAASVEDSESQVVLSVARLERRTLDEHAYIGETVSWLTEKFKQVDSTASSLGDGSVLMFRKSNLRHLKTSGSTYRRETAAAEASQITPTRAPRDAKRRIFAVWQWK